MGHGIIAWIIIGLLAGWITGKLMKGSGFGFFMDMIVGPRRRARRRIFVQFSWFRRSEPTRTYHQHRDCCHRRRASDLVSATN